MVDDAVILRGVGRGAAAAGGPTILQRTDQEFVDAVLEELSSGDGLEALALSVVSGGGALTPAEPAAAPASERQRPKRVSRRGEAAPVLELYQPVHRTFHVALLEAVCDGFMNPRLDPSRIESAGLVVRRFGTVGEETPPARGARPSLGGRARRRERLAGRAAPAETIQTREAAEAWVRSGKRIRGWVRLGEEGALGAAAGALLDPKADPDPERRPPPLKSGNAEVDGRLAKWLGLARPLAESTSPLFVAPPEVCKAAGRTILYGVIPLSSVERTEPPPPGASPADTFTHATSFDAQSLLSMLPDHLPPYLQRLGRQRVAPIVPLAEQTLTFANANDQALERFVLSLRQLRYEFDAFGERTPPGESEAEGAAIMRELNNIMLIETVEVTVPGPFRSTITRPMLRPTRPLGDFLKQAADILVELEGKGEAPGDVPTLKMPPFWPTVSPLEEGRLVGHIFNVLKKRLEGVASGEGRFDLPRAKYRARAFVRVKRRDGCPPATWWSDYSEPFTIAPWYESGDVPPVLVQLPDASDDGFLDKVKPNVAFAVPESLQNLLTRNTPDGFLKGEASAPSGEGLGLGWICGFNIPIITLCAFIVLNIFLQLLNIVFWWLFFIKICIPFPRRAPPPP